jgi:alpha-beta hydrolase superfamily lysophospholipase
LSIRKHWRKIALGLFLAVVLFLMVGIPYILAVMVTRAGTRPRDRALTSTPADYGLEFEEVHFSSRDGVSLGGWFLGGGSRNAVAICGHGLFRSRREVLDRAAFLRQQGYDTLLFDFRRHGESLGERVTLGYQERLDFEGAIDFVRRRRPGAPVVLYGVSMGAAAALLAAAETPEVAAVVADSSFLNIEHTVAHHVKLLFGLPRYPFASVLLYFLEMRGHFHRKDFDLEKAVLALGDRPVLIVAGGDDRRMPPELQKRLFEASGSAKSRYVVIAGAGHGAAYRVDPVTYQKKLVEFLDETGLASAAEEDGRGSEGISRTPPPSRNSKGSPAG